MTFEDEEMLREEAARRARNAAALEDIQRTTWWEKLRAWSARTRASITVHHLPSDTAAPGNATVLVQVRSFYADRTHHLGFSVDASGKTESEALKDACEQLARKGQIL